jgi:hypothetical protein
MPLICVIIFSGAKASLLLSKEVLLVVRTSGCYWIGLICFDWLKRVKLDKSDKGKIGKMHSLCRVRA